MQTNLLIGQRLCNCYPCSQDCCRWLLNNYVPRFSILFVTPYEASSDKGLCDTVPTDQHVAGGLLDLLRIANAFIRGYDYAVACI